VDRGGADGVLITGVYGSGKSSVAAEIACLLERRGEPYALLDLDYLSWAGTGGSDRASEFALMLRNLADVASNYRQAGIRLFVLAYFIRDDGELRAVREAVRLPLRVARLAVPLAEIEQRLAGDVTSGRRDDLRAAASAIAASEGAGVEDVVISNDRPIEVVAQEVMTFLGWL
jgi:adenylylsulfate kinase